MTRFYLTSWLVVLLAAWPLGARANDPAPSETPDRLQIEVSPESEYLLRPGAAGGELMLKLSHYPSNLLDQIKQQFSSHLVAARLMDKTDEEIIVALYLSSPTFKYSHSFKAQKPATLTITFLSEVVDVAPNGLAIVPLWPVWEALNDSALLLPPEAYRDVRGSGEANGDYLENVHLLEIGAYEAAIARIKESLAKGEGPTWGATLVLYGEALWQLSELGADPLTALKALAPAEREAPSNALKARALLMLGLANARAGLPVLAERSLAQGAELFSDLSSYFELALLQVSLSQHRLDEAQQLIVKLEHKTDLTLPMQAKLCIAKALFLGRQARLVAANEQVDLCTKGVLSGSFSAEQILAIGELRALSLRFSEAKEAYSRVLREFPTFRLAPLAALRLGDVAYAERKWEEAVRAYATASRGWPQSPYARLAELKMQETQSAVAGAPQDPYSTIDILHETWPIGREVLQKRIFNAAAFGQIEKAFTLYREFLRRYDGIYSWAFAADRLSRLVMAQFHELTLAKDHLGVIDFYNRLEDFPLAPDKVQPVVVGAADAYVALEHPEEAAKVLKRALNRPGRPLPDERSILIQLAETYLKVKDYANAVSTMTYFRSRFEEANDLATYYMVQSSIEMAQNRPEGAAGQLYFAMQASPDATTQRTLALKIGLLAFSLKNYPDAERYLRQGLGELLDEQYLPSAAKLTSEQRQGLLYLTDSSCAQKDYDACLVLTRRQLALMPNDRMANYSRYQAAGAALKAGYPATALAYLDTLTKADDSYWKQVGELRLQVAKWYEKHNLPMQ